MGTKLLSLFAQHFKVNVTFNHLLHFRLRVMFWLTRTPASTRSSTPSSRLPSGRPSLTSSPGGGRRPALGEH